MSGLSLAYRIATMPLAATEGLEAEVLDNLRLQRQAVIDGPKFDLQNVHDFYVTEEEPDWSVTDIPNWAPPFPSFWAEWEHVHDEEGEAPGRALYGALVGALRRGEGPLEELLDGRHLVYPAHLSPEDLRARAEWALGFSYFAAYFVPGLDGRPSWLRLRDWVFVAGDGGAITRARQWHPLVDDTCPEGERNAFVNGLLDTVGMGIAFSHCKNVGHKDDVRDRGERFHRRQKVPRFSYRTLVIDPMREVLRREGGLGAGGLGRALHICRGHFATYTAERPLFGHTVGQVWRPPHVRGRAEHGEVVKGYEVRGKGDR
jgi:hypothetical protein